MINSPICDIVGIKYPIFQGGMAWIADGKLAAAVSNAGGLGIISAMNADSNYLREQINIAKSSTDKPFGVNIMLQSPHAEEVAKVVAEEKGAAAVVAEGQESGGHIGELTTMAIVPQVVDAVNIPVIAAGGIADGRGVAAAFMLGAVGVQLGTRFLVAKECGVHQNYKDAVLKANDISTVTTGRRFGGNTCRSIKNTFTRNFTKEEYSPEATPESVANLGIGALRKAAVEGDAKFGCLLAGQISGMVNKEQTAEEIVTEIFTEAEKLLGGASKWVK